MNDRVITEGCIMQTTEYIHLSTVQLGIGGISQIYEEFVVIFACCEISWGEI